ncbi:MAG: transketolase [Burkholderiaceae bacterium]
MSAQSSEIEVAVGASSSKMANAIRALAMDAVQKAESGHPGMPMGMADISVALWKHHLRHNPANPLWTDRDRFILSNGHGSMLQYALLHLTGYDLPMQELETFRQLHSKTPGHPELGITPGVETTTGPLGQGFANAVGLALAEQLLGREFNRPGHTIVDHYSYVFMGDGCMMEGISHEAASLAGTWGLGKLVAFYDHNGISIDGDVRGWFTDDTAKRFEAYGWNVIGGKDGIDGHDVEAVNAAINEAKSQSKGEEKPTLIICRTIIGRGSPNREGTAKAHGEALGPDEVAITRKELGWTSPPFVIPQDVYDAWDAKPAGAAMEEDWDGRFAAYAKAFPEESADLLRRMRGDRPATWRATVDKLLAACAEKKETLATRKASAAAISAYVAELPEMFGGSADLTPSNNTDWKGMKTVRLAADGGRYVHYGVREFGMAAIMNGIALHGGFLPFGGTFLTFSDYMRNAIRMAAIMKLQTVFVFTHDSIGLGEDGPTHQSIEQTSSLRLIPHLDVWRPADTSETAVAWACAIERNHEDKRGPVALLLSRQNLAYQEKTAQQTAAIAQGGYVLVDARRPQVVLIGTGSEVGLAADAAKALATRGVRARVVSMPCTSVFDRQPVAYKTSVLPAGIPRVAIEAGVTDFWWKYVLGDGAVMGVDNFGESAPAKDVFNFFHLTVDNVVAVATKVVSGAKKR